MRILLALDGSSSSIAALDEICRRPWPPGSELRVITVISPIEFMLLHEESRLPESHEQKLYHHEDNYLLQAEEVLKERVPDLQFTAALLQGRPKEVILDEAERWGAELIVLGAHGYTTSKSLPLGSVAFAVALNAPCSVEIVRPMRK